MHVMAHPIGHIGRKTIQTTNHLLDLVAFFYRIFRLFFNRPKEGRVLLRKMIFEQIYFTAVQALPVIIPIALIAGSMLIFQFARISEHYDLGKTTVFIIVRQLGPIVTAILVILRSATAVTIETSYMNVLNEPEALEMAGLDPLRIICVPRLMGITTAVLCLFIVFDIVSIIGGYWVIWILTDVPISNFLLQIVKAITGADIIAGIIKALCFGVIITVTSLYQGFLGKKQMTDIPVGTSKSALECVILCLIANIIISAVFYL